MEVDLGRNGRAPLEVGELPESYPAPCSVAVSAQMRGNRRSDTRPEVALRSELHRLGLRFRKDLAVKAEGRCPHVDIVFTKARVAVFVDGCFWHCCPEHGRVPGGKNANYWEAKLTRNVERDRRDTEALTAAGWMVLRIWEHVPVTDAATEVMRVVAARGGGSAR